MSPRPTTTDCTGCGAKLTALTRRGNRCPDCVRAYYREWLKTPKAREKTKRAADRYRQTEHGQRRRKSANLMSAYGIDIEQFESMIADQDNKCLICEIELGTGNSRPCVDHCHATESVRGVLCFLCNAGLGCFRDNETALANAIEYLHATKMVAA